MFRNLIQTAALLLTVAALPAAAIAAPPPTELFFRNPSFGAAVLSPSGQLLAVTVGGKDSRDRLAVVDLQTMKVTDAASFEDADVRDFRWINDSRLVFNLGDRRLAPADQYLAPGAFAVNADGSQYRALVQRSNPFRRDPIERRELPCEHLSGRPGRRAEQRRHLHGAAAAAVGEGGGLRQALARQHLQRAPDGGGRAFAQLPVAAGRSGELRAVRTEPWTSCRPALARPGQRPVAQAARVRPLHRRRELVLQGIAPDGKLYVTARPAATPVALYLYDPATDKLADKPLLASPQYDIAPHRSSSATAAGGRALSDRRRVTHWFDDEMKAHQAVVDKLLPNTANLLTPPRRGDSPWMLLEAFSDVQPKHYLLNHAPTRKDHPLGRAASGCQGRRDVAAWTWCATRRATGWRSRPS
jgi:hypothetical protein